MIQELLDLLICPTCPDEISLEASVTEKSGSEILEGSLSCPCCVKSFPVTGGIPRFVESETDYTENFGYQWQLWRELQIDRDSGLPISEDRFFSETRWDRHWLAGKLILDAGCGAGRFADIAAKYGATVIACDMSQAIDACRETTAHHGQGRVHCVQASIYEFPLRKQAFDGVYCIGVIQHTPDTEKTIRTLTRYARPRGSVSLNFYEEGVRRRLNFPKYILRRFTPDMSQKSLLKLTNALVSVFFPISYSLRRIPILRQLNGFLPIAAIFDPRLTREQVYQWTVLNTFDWYGPRYETRQRYNNVMRLLDDEGLENVTGSPGGAWGRVPRENPGHQPKSAPVSVRENS